MSSPRSRIVSSSSRNTTASAAVQEAEEEVITSPSKNEETENRTTVRTKIATPSKTSSRTVTFGEMTEVKSPEVELLGFSTPEENLQRILAPAGLTPIEVIDTGTELFVKSYNTLAQKVYVKIPSNVDETDFASSMSNLARVEMAKENDEETTVEKIVVVTKPLLDKKTEQIICGHGAESHEGFCVSDLEERTVFTVVEGQESSYGHTSGDVIPAPIVPLSAVINHPSEVKHETIAQSMAIQRLSLQEARSQLSELVNTSVRTSRVSSVAAQTFEQKINKIGSEIARLNKEDINFEKMPANAVSINSRAIVNEKLIHKNHAFNVLVGNAYALHSAMEDLEAALAKINAVLEIINTIGQHHSC